MKATKLAAAIICLGSNFLAVTAAPNRKETFKDEVGTFIIDEHDGGATGSNILAVTAAPNRKETFKDEVGTFIIDEHDGEESGSKYQSMHVEFDDGLIYSLTDVDPSWVKSNRGNKGTRSGEARIRVRGVLSGTSFNLRGGAPEVAPDNRGRGNNRQLIEANTLTTGTRSVLAVRVVTGDGSAYGWPQEDLSNYVFGMEKSSLASVYKTCSYDQLNFVKANDRAMAISPADEDTTTDISNGVMTVKIDALPSDGEDAARQSIIQKLKEVFKTSPSNLADHVMFCLPPGVMENGGTARASVNHWYSMFSNEICNYPSFQAHEIGHNIDFGHSWETKEYDDTSGLMGYSFAQLDGPKMCFNGAKSFQSTWYRSATHVINPSGGAPRVNTEGCFAGKLYGISQYTGSPDQPVLLKINEPQPEMMDFIVSFNENSGINSGTKEGANQVLIHTVKNEGTVHNNSTLVAKLGARESFTIENFGNSGKDVIITVDAISSSPSFATVRIETGGEQCGCDGSLKTFQMRMKTDYYHEDVSWALTDTCTNSVVAFKDAYLESDIKFVEETDWVKHFATEQFCLPHSSYNVELFDSYGDGICCDYGSGDYEVSYDGAVVASGSQYNSGESTLFGSGSCGSVCNTIATHRKCKKAGCSWDKFNGMCIDV